MLPGSQHSGSPIASKREIEAACECQDVGDIDLHAGRIERAILHEETKGCHRIRKEQVTTSVEQFTIVVCEQHLGARHQHIVVRPEPVQVGRIEPKHEALLSLGDRDSIAEHDREGACGLLPRRRDTGVVEVHGNLGHVQPKLPITILRHRIKEQIDFTQISKPVGDDRAHVFG